MMAEKKKSATNHPDYSLSWRYYYYIIISMIKRRETITVPKEDKIAEKHPTRGNKVSY